MSIDKENLTLVCVPATAPMTLPGSVFTHSCGVCHERVMMSLDGQVILREHPEALIVCVTCVVVLMIEGEGLTMMIPSAEQIRNASRRAIPNPWMERN
jgi:hypothetical protein